jgi:hypothetical protein
MDGLYNSVKLLLREFDGFMSRLTRWLFYREWSSREVRFIGLLAAAAAVTWFVLRAARAKRMKKRHVVDHLEI